AGRRLHARPAADHDGQAAAVQAARGRGIRWPRPPGGLATRPRAWLVLDDVLPYLACPYCGAGLTRAGSALPWGGGQAFNVARQGYASLLPKKAHGEGGDTAAMVQARADFLAAGHFADLAAAVAGAAAEAVAAAGADGARAGCVVESGAGTGYYL